MPHNPGDTVYAITSIRLEGTRCTAEVRYGIADKNGNVVYRSVTAVPVTFNDDTLTAPFKTAVADYLAAHLPTQLTGAVPE